jgi:LmbE family N-acetylglucosaminyl deacetylase
VDTSYPQTGRTVVCSPHFDDAVLACWSVLEREETSEVVNVFTAAPPDGFIGWWDQLNGASSSAAHLQERVAEDRAALALADKSPIGLGMLETQYRLRHSRLLHTVFRRMPAIRFVMLRLPFLRPVLYGTPAPDAEQLADSITQAVPDASTVCLPAGIGGHPDHLIVRQCARVLASRGMTVRLYADMPYAIRYGWPAWISTPEGVRKSDRVGTFWARYLEPLRPLVPEPLRDATVVLLTDEERTRKAQAVSRYVTQYASLNAGRTRGQLDDTGVFAYEVYWQLQTPGGGSRQGF